MPIVLYVIYFIMQTVYQPGQKRLDQKDGGNTLSGISDRHVGKRGECSCTVLNVTLTRFALVFVEGRGLRECQSFQKLNKIIIQQV
jgi:hypothetical protein